MPLTVMEASTFEIGQELHLKGDVLIKGDMPAGVQITLTNGNLEIDGNLGSSTKLEVSGDIKFKSADVFCSVTAGGKVDFDTWKGGTSFIPATLSGTSVKGKKTGDNTNIVSTESDITIENLGAWNTLESANDIAFKEIGNFGELTATRNVYHDAGYPDDIRINSQRIIPRSWNNISQPLEPENTVSSGILEQQRLAALEKGQGI